MPDVSALPIDSANAEDGVLLTLSAEELKQVKSAFSKYDKDNTKSMDAWELKEALRGLGKHPTDDELVLMINEVDENGNGTIEYHEFVRLMRLEKTRQKRHLVRDDDDTLDAFIAMGGNRDRTGFVPVEKLKQVIKEFGLTLSIDEVLAKIVGAKIDIAWVDYEQFREILSVEDDIDEMLASEEMTDKLKKAAAHHHHHHTGPATAVPATQAVRTAGISADSPALPSSSASVNGGTSATAGTAGTAGTVGSQGATEPRSRSDSGALDVPPVALPVS
eukprot:GILK01007176.1.p1 GENE.GILK01007176.1~~GILK01007176.1.p1  ORF type:complete len:283 (+),score=58.23 GILK01007176.1:23-850(+)